MSIEWYVSAITQGINTLKVTNGVPSTVTSASNVSAQNPHRSLLESIRNDLYHFDEEKRARIIYTIEKYVEANPHDDPKLLEVLARVLQVVQQFKATEQVLVSPEKNPALPPERVSHTEINGIARRLDFLDNIL